MPTLHITASLRRATLLRAAAGPLVGMIGMASGLMLAEPASALSITDAPGVYTQVSDIYVSGQSTQSIAYQQFDPSRGTLTGVTFSFSGQTSGSFTLTAPSSPSAGYTLQAASTFITAEWGDPSAGPDEPLEAAASIFSVLTTPDSNFNVARNTTRTFTLSSPVNVSSGSTSYNNYLSYFTGTGSVNLALFQGLAYSGINSSTSNFANLTYGGAGSNATLVYTYAPVPAPLPFLGAIAGYGFLRRQRRRLNSTK